VALVAGASLVPVGLAQASDAGLRAAFRAGAPAIVRSQAKILNGVAAAEQSHKIGPLIKALNGQDRTLGRLHAKLAGIKPSSKAGARGRADVLNGLSLIIASNRTLLTGLEQKSLPKAQLRAAAAADKKGNVDLTRGAKLLKV
jgi:hypothetical protein